VSDRCHMDGRMKVWIDFVGRESRRLASETLTRTKLKAGGWADVWREVLLAATRAA